MEDKELRKKLDKILAEVQKSKNHWRFNFSVGCSNGDCYGASFENETNKKIL